MRGEHHRFSALAAFADEAENGARGHHVETAGGLIENHHRRIVHQGARDGNFLLHAGGERVAAAAAKFIHAQALEKFVDAPAQQRFVHAVQPAEVLHHFFGCKPRVERRRGGKETDVAPNLLALGFSVEAGDCGASLCRRKDGCQHAQRGGFASAIGAEQSVDLAGGAAEIYVLYGADRAALRTVKGFSQLMRFDHRGNAFRAVR